MLRDGRQLTAQNIGEAACLLDLSIEVKSLAQGPACILKSGEMGIHRRSSSASTGITSLLLLALLLSTLLLR